MSTAGTVRALAILCLGVAACSDAQERERGASDDAGADDTDAAAAATPPRIDPAKLLVVVENERVHVIGERGAVTPGAIEVEVQWPLTGELLRRDVARDGSFDVEVTGWIGERYRVQAVRRSPPARSELVFVWRTSDGVETAVGEEAANPAVDALGLSQCDELGLELDRQLGSFDIGGRCERDSDCTVVEDEGCGERCYVVGVPRGAEPLARAGFAAARASLCDDFALAGCLFSRGPFDEGCEQVEAEARCIDGACLSCGRETCAGVDLCAACPWPAIDWGPIGATPGSAHSLRDCHAFSSVLEDGAVCSSKLVCLGQGERSWYSAASLLSQLDYPDVRAALERNAYFGARVANAVGVQLNAGSGSITVSAVRCNGAAGCEEPPEEIMRLRDLLNGIVIQEEERCR